MQPLKHRQSHPSITCNWLEAGVLLLHRVRVCVSSVALTFLLSLSSSLHAAGLSECQSVPFLPLLMQCLTRP